MVKKEKVEVPYMLTIKEVTRYHKPYGGDAEDRRLFHKEYTTKSLEELFETGVIDGEEYDSEIELRDLRNRGILPNY